VEQPAPGPVSLRTQFDVTSGRRLIRRIFKKPNRITPTRRAGEGECPLCPISPGALVEVTHLLLKFGRSDQRSLPGPEGRRGGTAQERGRGGALSVISDLQPPVRCCKSRAANSQNHSHNQGIGIGIGMRAPPPGYFYFLVCATELRYQFNTAYRPPPMFFQRQGSEGSE
jgi:hypothetical protein